MRKKKALINIFFSVLLEVITVIAGLIVPRLIIGTFGSTTNGLVNSISSFIGYIALLQSGVGSVVKASLYKPLAKKNHEQLCTIISTSERFFKKIAFLTIVYLGILAFIFPMFIAKEFDVWYTASLVLIIGLSTAAQYFFGITYQMLLEADQRSHIYSIAQIIAVVLNTILVILLIRFHCSIQIVKLGSALIYVVRPIAVGWYAKRKYKINSKVPIDNTYIKQRWDGFLQAIAYFIHSKTDIFVLTTFASLVDVSIYSIYAMVTAGLSSVVNSIDKAVRSAFGNIIASDEKESLIKSFNAYNCLIHMFSTACFATAAVSVTNFIKIYVSDVTDANYIQPIFGILIITAEYFYCLRMPYNSIIYAAGKFKETKIPAIVEALINIIVSCILVQLYGLVGVAIGTLIAMVYRTCMFAIYLKNNILKLKMVSQIKRYFVTLMAYMVSIWGLSHIHIITKNYMSWILYAFLIFILAIIITFLINFIFDFYNVKNAVKMFLNKKRSR